MGLNIAGLVIDKNYQNNLEELGEVLGEKLVFEKEVSIDEALEKWKKNHYCDVLFSEKGTIVFFSMDFCDSEFYIENQKALAFIRSDATSMYVIYYTKHGEFIRGIFDNNGEIIEDEGEPLEIESEEADVYELTEHLFEETIGHAFDDMDFEATCYRYSFEGKEEAPEVILDKKPWWKFW